MKNWLKIVFVLDARPCISSWTSVTVFTTARWHSKTSARKPVCSKLIITSIIFHALPGFFFSFSLCTRTIKRNERTLEQTKQRKNEQTNLRERTKLGTNERTNLLNQRTTDHPNGPTKERTSGRMDACRMKQSCVRRRHLFELHLGSLVLGFLPGAERLELAVLHVADLLEQLALLGRALLQFLVHLGLVPGTQLVQLLLKLVHLRRSHTDEWSEERGTDGQASESIIEQLTEGKAIGS